MTTAITKVQQKTQTIRDIFAMKRVQKQLATVAPKHLTPSRLSSLALEAIVGNPKLLDCTAASLLQCVVTCAKIGLEIDSVGQRAHLIPYKTKCTLVLGFKGLKELAERSPEVDFIEPPRVVYSGDHFKYSYGLVDMLEHTPGDGSGELTHVYCIARMANGKNVFEVMTRAQVEAVRDKSQGKNADPWTNHFDEMARKTMLRKLCKYLPSSPELSRAVSLDEAAEFGIEQKLETIDIPGISEPAPDRAKQLEQELTQPEPEPAPAEEAPAKQPEKAPEKGNGTALSKAKAELLADVAKARQGRNSSLSDSKVLHHVINDLFKKDVMTTVQEVAEVRTTLLVNGKYDLDTAERLPGDARVNMDVDLDDAERIPVPGSAGVGK